MTKTEMDSRQDTKVLHSTARHSERSEAESKNRATGNAHCTRSLDFARDDKRGLFDLRHSSLFRISDFEFRQFAQR
jgi:hypothetical protein